MRVALPHSSGSRAGGDWGDLIDEIATEGGVLVTTYEGIRNHQVRGSYGGSEEG